MSLARRAARAALAASFISGGLDQLRNPQPKAGPAFPIAKPIADRVPQLPNDPESLVKIDGAIKVVGGVGLIFGPFARPAALLLAGSLVPTTLAGHRFWETTDPDQKVSDRVEFFKNVSLLGGLLIAALDTGGRPSVPYVAGKAVKGVGHAVGEAADSVGDTVSEAAGALAGAATAVGGAVASGAGRVSRRSAKKSAKAARKAEALRIASAAIAAKAAKRSARAARKARKDSNVSAKAAKARGAALSAGVAAKSAALSAGLAAREGAVAAKEKVGAAVSR
ncbi:MAG: DoxX family protein [Mycobacteriales bacterium]